MIERPIPIRQQASIYIQLCNMREDTATLLLFQLRNSLSHTLNTHSSKKKHYWNLHCNRKQRCSGDRESLIFYTFWSTQDDDIIEILLTVNTRQLCFGNWEILTVHTEHIHPQARNTANRDSVATTFEKFLSHRSWSRMQILFFTCHRQEAKIRFIYCNEPLFSFVKRVVDE